MKACWHLHVRTTICELQGDITKSPKLHLAAVLLQVPDGSINKWHHQEARVAILCIPIHCQTTVGTFCSSHMQQKACRRVQLRSCSHQQVCWALCAASSLLPQKLPSHCPATSRHSHLAWVHILVHKLPASNCESPACCSLVQNSEAGYD